MTNVKIAEADTYPQWMMGLPKLSAAVDLIIWHTYAYWSGVDISNAAAVVNGRYNDMLAMYPGKPIVLGETGWPTQVDHVSTDMTTTSGEGEVGAHWRIFTSARAPKMAATQLMTMTQP